MNSSGTSGRVGPLLAFLYFESLSLISVGSGLLVLYDVYTV